MDFAFQCTRGQGTFNALWLQLQVLCEFREYVPD